MPDLTVPVALFLPVEEPLGHKVEPVFGRGIEEIEPDIAPGMRESLQNRQHQRRHDEGHEDVERIGERHRPAVPEIKLPQIPGRPGEGLKRLGERLEKTPPAPAGIVGKPLPERALPDKVGVRFHPPSLVLHFFCEDELFLVESQPLEHPVESVACVGDEDGTDALRERKDFLFRSSSQAVLKPHRPRLHFLPEAPRSRFSENLPDHPVRFVADHIGERLLRKEPEPLREKHELH